MRVVITGASGSLGGAVLQHFHARGDQIVAVGRTGGEGAVAAGDLADWAVAQAALNQAATMLGGIDALVHIAGGFVWQAFADTDVATMRAMFSGNVETVLTVTRAALPHLADHGAIVTVGAASAQPAGVGFAAYASAKSAVARLTEVLAVELAPRGIRANGVLPAIIDTPANRAAMPEADPATWTTPQAIAEVIAFLASPAARAVNGAMIPVTNAG